MGLSPEERRKIYEEEKARIEAEERAAMEKQAGDESTGTGLKPTTAALLCYVGIWVAGIIFLVLEQKNKFVRFHAMQSIVVFGILTIAGVILGSIPLVGVAFSSIISVIGFILWIILIIKASQGQLCKVPWAGNVAEKLLGSLGEPHQNSVPPEPSEPPKASETSSPPADLGKKISDKVEEYFKRAKSERIAYSSAAIVWGIILLIFFNFFNSYIAYYHDGVRDPILTAGFNAWLPLLNTALIASVVGHIILLIFYNYILRQVILIALNILGIAVVVNLLVIFPFNFGVIPNAELANVLPTVTTIILILSAVGLGIGALVMFIQLIVNAVRQSINY